MIEIISEFKGKAARLGSGGDLNGFMRSLVVEVVSENYRQALFEHLLLEEHKHDQSLDVALRAKERVVSGLFAFALGKMCGFVRPEVKTDKEDSWGHVDFLAWYSRRVIAIELKAGHISVWNEDPRKDTVKRWAKAITQAKDAQTHLRKEAQSDVRLQDPISIALMIVSGRSAISPKEGTDGSSEDTNDIFKKALKSFRPKAQFMAIYSVPHELQNPARLKAGVLNKEGEQTYTPCYGFLAKVRVHGDK
jgi:hypothetical protein